MSSNLKFKNHEVPWYIRFLTFFQPLKYAYDTESTGLVSSGFTATYLEHKTFFGKTYIFRSSIINLEHLR